MTAAARRVSVNVLVHSLKGALEATAMDATGGWHDAGDLLAVLPATDFERLFNDAPCGFLITDLDGVILHVNSRFATWTGFAAGELVRRRSFQELLSVESQIYYQTDFEPTLGVQRVIRDVPLELDMIVIRALQREPEQRYMTWAQFIEDLASMMRGTAALPTQGVFETERFNSLRKLSFFEGFADVDMWEVMRFSEWVDVPKDTVILREGDLGYYFCILVSGEARVTRQRRLIDVLKPGECLGEMACLGSPGNLRTADVTASQEVRLLKISDDAYHKATDSCRIRFERAFLRVLVERLIEANAKLTMV